MDNLMWQAIISIFERPDIVAAKYAEYKADKEDGLAVERDRLAMLENMLQDADRKRRLNMQLAGSEEDDEQRAEYQHIATEAARSMRGINTEIETLKGVLATKQRDDETLDALASIGAQAVERLREADFDDKRRTLLALDAKLYIRRKGDVNAVEFECRLSERFDPTALCVQSHL